MPHTVKKEKTHLRMAGGVLGRALTRHAKALGSILTLQNQEARTHIGHFMPVYWGRGGAKAKYLLILEVSG